MRLEIRLVLPADARLLPSTRMAMLAHLRALGVDEDCCDDVILALDEACANVVRHAFPGALAAGRWIVDERDAHGNCCVRANAHPHHQRRRRL